MTFKNNILTEQQIQTKIKKKLQAQGYFVTKLIKTSTNGIPDLLAIKDGQATFIEVKKENGILSPLQELRISELKKHGCFVYLWSDWNVNFVTK